MQTKKQWPQPSTNNKIILSIAIDYNRHPTTHKPPACAPFLFYFLLFPPFEFSIFVLLVSLPPPIPLFGRLRVDTNPSFSPFGTKLGGFPPGSPTKDQMENTSNYSFESSFVRGQNDFRDCSPTEGGLSAGFPAIVSCLVWRRS